MFTVLVIQDKGIASPRYANTVGPFKENTLI